MVDAILRVGAFGAGLASVIFIAKYHGQGGNWTDYGGMAIISLVFMIIMLRLVDTKEQ